MSIRIRPPAQLLLAIGMALAGLVALASRSAGQAAGPSFTMQHMEMSPRIRATPADSQRAARIVQTLRTALAPYHDTTAAVAAGYRMFAPQLKNQKVYHFTNSWRAVAEGFRFDPAKPSSLLYVKGTDGGFRLIGAMYTAPRRFSPDKLDSRVPLGVARWHKHVNWCVPKRGESKRWLERRDGAPLFGPESPIVTKEGCDAVHGTFRDNVLGWMVHANVFASDDPAVIWGDQHDMHESMAMDVRRQTP